MNREAMRSGAAELGLALDEHQLDGFDQFEEALYFSNQTRNLTRVPREECVVRHFLDSLTIAPFLNSGDELLDLGTGPGFPAWPLAIARPDLAITAMDSNAKMLNFLREHPLENLRPLLGRVEDSNIHEKFAAVTGRAVAPLPIQMEISARPLKPGGRWIAMRTPVEEEQIEQLDATEVGLELRTMKRIALPHSDIVRLIAVFEKTAPTPRRYPRSWAEIKRDPIS